MSAQPGQDVYQESHIDEIWVKSTDGYNFAICAKEIKGFEEISNSGEYRFIVHYSTGKDYVASRDAIKKLEKLRPDLFPPKKPNGLQVWLKNNPSPDPSLEELIEVAKKRKDASIEEDELHFMGNLNDV